MLLVDNMSPSHTLSKIERIMRLQIYLHKDVSKIFAELKVKFMCVEFYYIF